MDETERTRRPMAPTDCTGDLEDEEAGKYRYSTSVQPRFGFVPSDRKYKTGMRVHSIGCLARHFLFGPPEQDSSKNVYSL